MRKAWLVYTALMAVGLTPTSAYADNEPANADPCKVVEQKDGLSSTITIGNGKATASTTMRGPSGSSVSVHAGGGGASSSVATATGNGTTVIASSDEDCIETRDAKDNSSKGN